MPAGRELFSSPGGGLEMGGTARRVKEGVGARPVLHSISDSRWVQAEAEGGEK